jgi:hypothetical protein
VGALTLQQMIAEVRAGLGNRVEAALTDTRVTNALNLAQSRLGRFYNFQEMNQDLVTTYTITGTEAIDKFLPLPSGIKVIHSLIVQDGANSQKLVEKPWRMFDKRVPLPEYIAASWPYYYTRFGVAYVMLFPVPLQNFQFFMRATMLATPFDSTVQTATSMFVDKDDILIDWALEYLFRLYARPDLADSYDKMALERAVESKKNEESRPDMDASEDSMASGGLMGPYWQNAFIRSPPVGGDF